MGYFNELPNLQILNRTKNKVSNDETLIIKNFFKRAKLREDIGSISSAFEVYMINGDERPEQIAEKYYGDPELDWTILLANNITNINNEWPLTLDGFNKFMIHKYGSEDAYDDIHHYETLEVKDSFGRVVFPGGLKVDEEFYNAPRYETITEIPPGITFPPIYVPGTQAVLNPVIGAGNSIADIQIANAGLGYQRVPTVNVSPPPVTANASAASSIFEYKVSGISTLDGGQGYNFPPTVLFSEPIQSVQATAVCALGDTTGPNLDKVDSITSIEGGLGYGVTAPSVTFSFSPQVVYGVYNNQSSTAVGNDVEGFYFKTEGDKLYTSSFTGTNQIKQYNLSVDWKVSTTSLYYELDVSGEFGFTTGVEFKPDGTLMYVTGGTGGSYKIATYELSTAWDLATASVLNTVSIASPGGIRFKPDGTSVFILDFTNPDVIKEYTLATPWSMLSRSGSPVRSYQIITPSNDNDILGFNFNPDGTKLFATSEGTSSVYEFDMDAWEIDTAEYKYSFYVGDRVQSPADVFIKTDREKFVVAGGNLDRIYEYNTTSTAKGITQIDDGKVSAIVITQPGVAYTVAPTVTIGAPFPAVRAEGTPNLTSGIITSITITNPGFGYTVAPTITIGEAPISRQAVVVVTLSNTGIGTFRIADGGLNYVTTPTLTLDAPDEVLNTPDNTEYSQSLKTWRWNGTVWQEKVTDEFQYFEPNTQNIVKVNGNVLSKPVTNYEYENNLNEEKRKISLLKPEFISVIVTDLRNMMVYDEDDPNYIDDTLKKTYNEKIMGI